MGPVAHHTLLCLKPPSVSLNSAEIHSYLVQWTLIESLSIASSQLNSLKSAITGSSRARHFYLHILRQGKYAKDTLIKRVQLVCSKYDINFLNFLFNQSYARHCKSKLKQCTTDGVIDSIKMLLIDYNDFNRDLVKLLIMPF